MFYVFGLRAVIIGFKASGNTNWTQCIEKKLFVRDFVVLDGLGAKIPDYKPIGH